MTDTLTFQGSLLDLVADGPSFDPTFQGLRRHHLPDGAWVDRLPGWVQGGDRLYRAAEAHLPWRTGVERIRGDDVARPRLVATVDRDRLPDELRVVGDLSDVLSERCRAATASRSIRSASTSTATAATASRGMATGSHETSPKPPSRSCRSVSPDRSGCGRGAAARACPGRSVAATCW